MKLNDKKFGKIFAEPNRTCQNQPNPEPNRNFGRFLILMSAIIAGDIASSGGLVISVSQISDMISKVSARLDVKLGMEENQKLLDSAKAYAAQKGKDIFTLFTGPLTLSITHAVGIAHYIATDYIGRNIMLSHYNVVAI